MPSGAFRKKKISYAQVSNFALRDEKLSLKAKGLLSLIESYINLENFTLYKQFLINKYHKIAYKFNFYGYFCILIATGIAIHIGTQQALSV